MFETSEEFTTLQQLLDASYANAGPHARSTIDETRRPTALEVCERMTGMCLITVATVTADGRPISGPFDGYVVHGSLWFTSAVNGVRIRHLEHRPAISATYLPEPEFALWMHGTASVFALSDPICAPVKQAMLDHYLPIQGPSFAEWIEHLDARAVRIDPVTVLAFCDTTDAGEAIGDS